MRSMPEPSLLAHPDRLFPPDPTTRKIAQRLYAETRALPIISPHGHVPPEWLADNAPFADPTHLLLQPDHYVLRMLHANGADLSEMRSEEHTSELQSRGHLVCRLLLEKKNTDTRPQVAHAKRCIAWRTLE